MKLGLKNTTIVLLLLYPLMVLTVVAKLFIVKFPIPMGGRFLISIFIYLLAYFLYGKTLKTLYIRTVYLISLILVFFESAYILLYKTKITSSAVYILMETNRSEATEYLREYFNKEILILLLILVLPSLFIFTGIKKVIEESSPITNSLNLKNSLLIRITDHVVRIWKMTQSSVWKKYVTGGVFFSFAFLLLVKNQTYANSLGFNLYLGYKEYKEETAKYQQYFSNSENSPVLKSVQPKTDTNKETLIITIGESTTRYNLGIYGYSRNTTPNLEK